MKSTVRIAVALSVLVALNSTSSVAAVAPMQNYCVTPPFIQTPILPNLLLMIDNSASQYDLAYIGDTDCYDATYNRTTTYEGYFPYPKDISGVKTGDYIFKYDMDSASATFNKFVRVNAFPTTTATYNTDYLYVRMSGTGTTRYVADFYAKGNFLNWLAMSKIDIQKNVLTGGKWIPATPPYLLGQSRGCNGSRYIKSIPYNPTTGTGDWINKITDSTGKVTFNLAIRGPKASENYSASNPNNLISPATLGGQTKIEIYESGYNYAECNTAINSWQNQILGNGVGSTWTDVQACLGTTGTGNTAAGRENANYNEWVRDCIQIAQNIRNGKTTYPDIIDNVTPNNFAGQCETVYTSDCSGVSASNTANAANLTAIESCGTLQNPLGGNFICSRKANLHPPVASPYNAADNTTLSPDQSKLNDGYAGSCWTGQTKTGNALDRFTPAGDPNCLAREILHFCASTAAAHVIDPTGGTAATPTSGSLPGILVEAGLRSGGEPLPFGSATDTNKSMLAQVDIPTPPNGLIQRYQGSIRLGVMSFNFDGSSTECYDPVTNTGPATSQIICGRYCTNTTTPGNSSLKACRLAADCLSGETCTLSANRDGSRILDSAYVGDPVGTHTSGIIQSVDNITGTSWTPFAEAMYNAIGYFAADPSTKKSRWNLSNSDDDFIKSSRLSPQQYPCQANNVMLITDGMSTADQNATVSNVATWAQAASGLDAGQVGYNATNKCPTFSGSRDFDDLVWLARNKNINTLDISSSTALAASAAPGTTSAHKGEYITTYIVYTGTDQPSMPGQCNSKTLMTAAATKGGTSLFLANQPSAFKTQLDAAFAQIAGGASSGTAASILSNSEGSGAALLQAIFYPLKKYDNQTEASWLGELQSFWYYLDPFLQKTSIREDTIQPGDTASDYKLNLKQDKVVSFYFDANDDKTKVNKYTDANGDGSADSTTPDTGFAGVAPETLNSLWKAGEKLWKRDVSSSASPRTIFTGYGSTAGSTPAKFSNVPADNFNTSTSSTVWDILQIPTVSLTTTTLTDTERYDFATRLINYVHGTDQEPETAPLCLFSSCKYRNRKVTIQSFCSSTASDFSACTKEWKLGDIISSTPKLVSNVALNTFSLPSPTGYNDTSYSRFTKTTGYKSRGMAFVGANDGMLHAFKMGILKELGGIYDKAQLTTSTNSTVVSDLQAELGEEAWAFIPKHALPYLNYMADPAYSHIYYVDRTPTIVDASIAKPSGCASSTDYSLCVKSSDGSTWRTILIGGMGTGGASREADTSHPLAVSPPVTTSGNKYGYSSYFALDVTSPSTPIYLWEFSNPSLGFTTTGPAIVKITPRQKNTDGSYRLDSSGNYIPDLNKNGKWYAVFASGPNGNIDSAGRSFKGKSDQPLKIFVVDLASGTLDAEIDLSSSPNLGLTNAFAGSLATSVIDVDKNTPFSPGFYSDDAIYIGYTKLDSGSCTTITDTACTWNSGGVLRVLTHESTNPVDWTFSKLIDGIGPVTTSVTKLQDRANKNLWLYTGTGRYYYKEDDTSATKQALYGIKDPCYNTITKPGNYLDVSCSASVTSGIVDQTGVMPTGTSTGTAPATTLDTSATGWKILLDGKNTDFLTERVITDPLASPSGAVFFTTFKPSSDLCKYGGNSLLWAVRYNTGGAPASAAMQGKALMQVSTGAFQEITLSSAFGDSFNRKLTTPITGVPPTAQGLSLFSNPMPIKKILQYQEK